MPPFSSCYEYRLLTVHSWTSFQELPSLMEAALPGKAPVVTPQDFWWRPGAKDCSEGACLLQGGRLGRAFMVCSCLRDQAGVGYSWAHIFASCLLLSWLPHFLIVFTWEPPIITYKSLCLRLRFTEAHPEKTALLCSRHTLRSVADHSNKSNITINWFTWIFFLFSCS